MAQAFGGGDARLRKGGAGWGEASTFSQPILQIDPGRVLTG